MPLCSKMDPCPFWHAERSHGLVGAWGMSGCRCLWPVSVLAGSPVGDSPHEELWCSLIVLCDMRSCPRGKLVPTDFCKSPVKVDRHSLSADTIKTNNEQNVDIAKCQAAYQVAWCSKSLVNVLLGGEDCAVSQDMAVWIQFYCYTHKTFSDETAHPPLYLKCSSSFSEQPTCSWRAAIPGCDCYLCSVLSAKGGRSRWYLQQGSDVSFQPCVPELPSAAALTISETRQGMDSTSWIIQKLF